MSPIKIMLIRHAEKPVPDGANGVTQDGSPDPESLSEIGWKRARALVGFFSEPKAEHVKTPDLVFAAAPEVGSKRPAETVMPLVEALWPAAQRTAHFDLSVKKAKIADIAEKAMAANGVVLIAWEHSLIHAIVSALPHAPATPTEWPGHRFDVVWILNAKQGGWDFHQTPQMLLEGDDNSVIPFTSPGP
jgi:hypothetical protein